MSPEILGFQIGKKATSTRRPVPGRYSPYSSGYPRPPERRPNRPSTPSRPLSTAEKKVLAARKKLALTAVGITALAGILTGGVVIIGPKVMDAIHHTPAPSEVQANTPEATVLPTFTPMPTDRILDVLASPTPMGDTLKKFPTPTVTQADKEAITPQPTIEILELQETKSPDYQPVPDVLLAAKKLTEGQKPIIVPFDKLTFAQITAIEKQGSKNGLNGALGITQTPVSVRFEKGTTPLLKTGNSIFDRFYSKRDDVASTTTLTYNLDKVENGELSIGSNLSRSNGDSFYYDAQSDTLYLMTTNTPYSFKKDSNQGENYFYYSIPNASQFHIRLPAVGKANIWYEYAKLDEQRKAPFIDSTDNRTLIFDPKGKSFGFEMGRGGLGGVSFEVQKELLNIRMKKASPKSLIDIRVNVAENAVSGSSQFDRSKFPFAMVNTSEGVALITDPLVENGLVAPLDYNLLTQIVNTRSRSADKLSVFFPMNIQSVARVDWQSFNKGENTTKVQIGNLQLDIGKTRIKASESTHLTVKEIKSDDTGRQFDMEFGKQKSAKVSAWGQSVDLAQIDKYGIFTIPFIKKDGHNAYLIINYIPESETKESDLVLRYSIISEDGQPISQEDSDHLKITALQTRLKNLSALSELAKVHQRQVKVEAKRGSTKGYT